MFLVLTKVERTSADSDKAVLALNALAQNITIGVGEGARLIPQHTDGSFHITVRYILEAMRNDGLVIFDILQLTSKQDNPLLDDDNIMHAMKQAAKGHKANGVVVRSSGGMPDRVKEVLQITANDAIAVLLQTRSVIAESGILDDARDTGREPGAASIAYGIRKSQSITDLGRLSEQEFSSSEIDILEEIFIAIKTMFAAWQHTGDLAIITEVIKECSADKTIGCPFPASAFKRLIGITLDAPKTLIFHSTGERKSQDIFQHSTSTLADIPIWQKAIIKFAFAEIRKLEDERFRIKTAQMG